MWQIILLLPVAVALWLLYEVYQHSAVQYKTTEVEYKGLDREIRFCLISDLHNNRKNYSNIVECIRDFRPEAVLLAGDMVDKRNKENTRALQMLKVLAGEFPVYYSEGNHEASLKSKHPELWEEYIQDFPENVVYLDNRGVFLEEGNGSSLKEPRRRKQVFISGLSLPKNFYKKGSLYKKEDDLPDLPVPENCFHVLLAHNPEYAPIYSKYKADLILSGHLHGGLLRLPFLGGMVSPRLRFPAKDAGLSRVSEKSFLFISRGLGSHTIPLRFFNRVEVNFIVLKGTKER